MPRDLQGITVTGSLERVLTRKLDNGAEFHTAHLVWMGGAAYVQLARGVEAELPAEGTLVTLSATPSPYVGKDGKAGVSFRGGRIVS